MFVRLVTPIRQTERDLICRLAEIERRTPEAQGAFLIREALEKRGLLQPIRLTEIVTDCNNRHEATQQ